MCKLLRHVFTLSLFFGLFLALHTTAGAVSPLVVEFPCPIVPDYTVSTTMLNEWDVCTIRVDLMDEWKIVNVCVSGGVLCSVNDNVIDVSCTNSMGIPVMVEVYVDWKYDVLASGNGTTYDGHSWVLDEAGTLIITGSGTLGRYWDGCVEDVPPWYPNRSFIKKVILSEGFTEIEGGNTFYECAAEEISFPSTLVILGDNCFSCCTGISQIVLPPSLQRIGNSCFRDSTLSTISIPDTVTYIGTAAFLQCYSLEEIHIPSGVTSILGQCFYNCTSLTTFSDWSNITSIGSNAFYGCTSLVGPLVLENVTSVGVNAFNSCTSLEKITLSKALTTVNSLSFTNIAPDSEIWTYTPSLFVAGTNYTEANTTIHGIYCPEAPVFEHGTLTYTDTEYIAGDAVTFRLDFDSGYSLGSISAVDDSGNPIDLADNGDGTYTYTQPESVVTITVVADTPVVDTPIALVFVSDGNSPYRAGQTLLPSAIILRATMSSGIDRSITGADCVILITRK